MEKFAHSNRLCLQRVDKFKLDLKMADRWIFRPEPAMKEMYNFLEKKFGKHIREETKKDQIRHFWSTPYGLTFSYYPVIREIWYLQLDSKMPWFPRGEKDVHGCMGAYDVKLMVNELEKNPHRLWRPEPPVIQLADRIRNSRIVRHHMGPRWHVLALGFSAINNPFNLSTGYCSSDSTFEVQLNGEEPLHEQTVDEIFRWLAKRKPEILRVREKKLKNGKPHRCHFCRQEFKVIGIRKRCSRCRKVCYCAPLCQSKDWSEHKKICQPVSNE
jgi:hypothetical protein